jgi:hypothetical protein
MRLLLEAGKLGCWDDGAMEDCLLADVGVCCVAWGEAAIDPFPLSKPGIRDILRKLDEGKTRYSEILYADLA